MECGCFETESSVERGIRIDHFEEDFSKQRTEDSRRKREERRRNNGHVVAAAPSTAEIKPLRVDVQSAQRRPAIPAGPGEQSLGVQMLSSFAQQAFFHQPTHSFALLLRLIVAHHSGVLIVRSLFVSHPSHSLLALTHTRVVVSLSIVSATPIHSGAASTEPY